MIAEQLRRNFATLKPIAIRAEALSLDRDRAVELPDEPRTTFGTGTRDAGDRAPIGGRIAIEQNTFAKELSSWQNELTVGSPFANVVAQDIMEPFPGARARSTEPSDARRFASQWVPIWPFVNHEGRLVGVVTPGHRTTLAVRRDPARKSRTLTNPVTIAHNATFPEIYEAFSTQGCLEMVVVADHRPIGYLTFDGFISLIEPIDSATFSRDEADDDSRSLLVGSLVMITNERRIPRQYLG